MPAWLSAASKGGRTVCPWPRRNRAAKFERAPSPGGPRFRVPPPAELINELGADPRFGPSVSRLASPLAGPRSALSERRSYVWVTAVFPKHIESALHDPVN